jgi:hypothetical protein
MSDFLSRLVQHTRGETATVRPVFHAATAPDPGAMAWDEQVTAREAPPLARSPRARHVPLLAAMAPAAVVPPAPAESSLRPTEAVAAMPLPSDEPERWRTPESPNESALPEVFAALRNEPGRTPHGAHFAVSQAIAAMPLAEVNSRRPSSPPPPSAAARVDAVEQAVPPVPACLATSSLPPARRPEPRRPADCAPDVQDIAAAPSNPQPSSSAPLAQPAAKENGIASAVAQASARRASVPPFTRARLAKPQRTADPAPDTQAIAAAPSSPESSLCPLLAQPAARENGIDPAVPQAPARPVSAPSFTRARLAKPQRTADPAPDTQAIAAAPSNPESSSSAPLAQPAARDNGIDPAIAQASARRASAPTSLPPARPPELWRSAEPLPSAQPIALAIMADKALPSVNALAPARQTSNSETLALAAPRRPAREPEARLQEHSTTVEVSIGRIEVRLPTRPRSAADRAPPPRRATVGLAEYLSNREAGKTR